MNRRSFLKATGLAVGGLAVGLPTGALDARVPAIGRTEPCGPVWGDLYINGEFAGRVRATVTFTEKET